MIIKIFFLIILQKNYIGSKYINLSAMDGFALLIALPEGSSATPCLPSHTVLTVEPGAVLLGSPSEGDYS